MKYLAQFLRTFPYTIAIGLLVSIGYFAFFEQPFLSYKNVPFPVHVPFIRPGQPMPITVIRCSSAPDTREYVVTHRMESVDLPTQQAIVLPSQLTTIDPGCETVTSLINMVPPETPPGRYRIHGTGTVRGVLRTLVVPWYSEPYEVTL